MESFQIQLFFNSGLFVVIMTRYADKLMSEKNCWKFALFVFSVFLVNMVLLVDGFGLAAAMYKAGMISIGFVVGVVVMAYFIRKKKGSK